MCRNKIVDKLIEECSENIDGSKMLYNKTLNTIPLDAISLYAISLDAMALNTKACNSCTIYIALFVMFFIARICISSTFNYFH